MGCLNCSRQLKKNAKKFCCTQCDQDWRYAERLRKWLAGEISGSRGHGDIASWVGRFLIDEAGNRCTKCGWSEANPLTGRVTLTIDHKDGDHLNNSRENLEVLCYNCHTLTPTFNQLNRGNGTRYVTPGTRMRTTHGPIA